MGGGQRDRRPLLEDGHLAHLGDVDREPLAGQREDASPDRRRAVEEARRHLRNLRTIVTSCSGVNGFGRYSSAPCRMPQRRSLCWFFELPTTTRVGGVRWSWRRLRRPSTPSRRGITMPSRTTWGRSLTISPSS